MRAIALTITLLFSFVFCRAQTPRLARGASAAAPKIDTAKVSYNPFADKTTVDVEIKPAKVAFSDGSSELFPLPLSASYDCAGHSTRCAPSRIWLSYVTPGYGRCDGMRVVFLADGKRIVASKCQWFGGAAIVFSMSAANFISLAKASRAEAKIGLWVWTFDAGGMDAIRSLAAHIHTRPGAVARRGAQ